jgi:hypothetical protein
MSDQLTKQQLRSGIRINGDEFYSWKSSWHELEEYRFSTNCTNCVKLLFIF